MSARTQWGGLVLLLPAVALLAGCAGGTGDPDPGSPPPGAPPSDVIVASRASATAPRDFHDRTPLPSCGDFALGQGESLPDDAVDCLRSAGDEGAELAFARPTVEGDPIVYFYRVNGDGRVEVFIDATRDRFGSAEWTNEVFVDGTFDWNELP